MKRAETRVQKHSEAVSHLSEFHTAVSLHSHTHYSKESLDFLPYFLDVHRVPFVSRRFQAALKRYKDRHGKGIDFTRAYWTPPVTPGMVFASEKAQIERDLGLEPIVSITDHDTIAAPLSLRQQQNPIPVPISVEWSVPFENNTFHLGVHHLPPERAQEAMKELSLYTAKPDEKRLGDLLAYLNSFPEVLLVFNHPWANFVWVDTETHRRTLLEFLAKYREWIHALEFNGIRSLSENRASLELAQANDLPVVGGGDRHGRRPTTIVNLIPGKTWGEFVDRVRTDRSSDLVMMKAYHEPVPLRKLADAGDVLRNYPNYPEGQRRFTERIFASLDGDGWHPLCHYWDKTSPPKWVSPAVKVTIGLAGDNMRHILAWLLSLRREEELAAFPMRPAPRPEAAASAEEA